MNRITGGQIRMDAMLLESAQQVACESSNPMIQAIQAKLAEFGFQVRVPEDLDKKFKVIHKEEIDPKTLSKMGPVFEDISVEISAGIVEEEGKWFADIILEYRWEHWKGSNGLKCRFVLEDGKWSRWQ